MQKSEAGTLIARRKRSGNLSFEVIEVPAEEGSLDDLLDLIAELLVGKWMEEKDKQD